MKNANILLFFFIILFCSTLISSYKQDNCINVIHVCSNCTFVNITSVVHPDSSITNLNLAMTKNNNVYSYNYCNTSQLGDYLVSGLEDSSGNSNSWTSDFVITKLGEVLSVASSIMYVVFLLLSLIVFIFFLFIGFTIEGSNHHNEEGLIEVNHAKYLKMGCFFMAYLVSIWLFFNLYVISDNFLYLTFITNFFHAIFTILISITAPLFFGFVIFLGYWLVKDSKLKEFFEKGIENGGEV